MIKSWKGEYHMSVLEGGIDPREVFPVKNPYGVELREIFKTELDGATDVAVNETGDTAYIAGNNILYIFDIKEPEKPLLLNKLKGIGSGRQIEVQGGLAFITSRPDGLFICDVKNPLEPAILCHYDTIELATGVCVSGNLCFVTCRHFGVEIIDISNPCNPMHLSNVLAGEAQSVFVDGCYMYVGAWINKEAHIFDISDPVNPRHLSVCPLDGFGDGVFVRNDVCFIATGHHARKLVNRKKYANYDFVTEDMLRDGYGGGHGLEIYDVSDKKNPELLSRIKTPPLFLSSNDMWDVTVSGNHAFLADTYNGIFIIDISDLRAPFFVGYKRLGVYASLNYLHQPSIQQPCNPVNGIAVVEDYVLAVSAFSGLHVIEATGKAKTAVYNKLHISASKNRKAGDKNIVFQTKGQVHALAFSGEYMVVAAGDQGIYVLDYKNGYDVISHVQTAGFAMDIKSDGKYLYVAEGHAGFSVWQLKDGALERVSGYKNETGYESVRQVVLYQNFGLAALHIGTHTVAFMDISDPASILCKGYSSVKGMMYYKSIVDGLLDGRFAIIAPLALEPVWYDLCKNNSKVEKCAGFDKELCPIEEGIAVKGNVILTILGGKYYVSHDFHHALSDENMIPVKDSKYIKEPGSMPCKSLNYSGSCRDGDRTVYLSGRPKIIDNTLCLVNRQKGDITLVNIEDIYNPALIEKFTVDGNPEDIVFHDGAMWIPCGHGGLYRKPFVTHIL